MSFFIIDELSHAWRCKRQSKRQLIAEVALAITLAFAIIIGKSFILDRLALPQGLSWDPNLTTLVQRLPSGEPLKFQRRTQELLSNSRLKDHFSLYAEQEKPVSVEGITLPATLIAMVSSNFYQQLAVPFAQGQAPADDSLYQVVVSEAFLQQQMQGDMNKTLQLDGESFSVAGVLDSRFCGLGLTCPAVWFNQHWHYLMVSERMKKLLYRNKAADDKKALILLKGHGELSLKFHFFLTKPAQMSGTELQSIIDGLPWDSLKEMLILEGGLRVYSSLATQQTELSLFKGISVDPQYDAELSPILRLIAMAAFALALFCLMLFTQEQLLGLRRRLPELTIRAQLGSQPRHWWRFLMAELMVATLPCFLLTLAVLFILINTLGTLPLVKQVLQGRGLAIEAWEMAWCYAILLLPVAIVLIKQLWPIARNTVMNRSRLDLQSRGSITYFVMLAAGVTLMIVGVAVSVGFNDIVKRLTAADRVGNAEKLWNIHYEYKYETKSQLPAVALTQQYFEQKNIDYAIYDYAPGIDALNYPENIEVLGASNRASAFQQRVSSDFYALFGLDLLHGLWPNAQQPNEVVISLALAHQLAGSADQILNQTLALGKERELLRVVGIVSDMRYNSTRGLPEGLIYRQLSTSNSDDPNSYNFYQFAIKMPTAMAAKQVIESYQQNFELIPSQLTLTSRQQQLAQKNRFYQTLGAFAPWLSVLTTVILLMFVYGNLSQILVSRRRELAINIAIGSPLGRLFKSFWQVLLVPLVIACVLALVIVDLLMGQLALSWHIQLSGLNANGLLSGLIALLFIIGLANWSLWQSIKKPQQVYLR